MGERQSREEWLATLDPGIAPYVDVLDAHGIETYESCQGGKGHSYPEPTVRFFGAPGKGFHAVQVAIEHGLPVRQLNRFWTVNGASEPEGPNWELVFWRPALRPNEQSEERYEKALRHMVELGERHSGGNIREPGQFIRLARTALETPDG